MSHYFTGGESKYGPALRVTDKREADAFFAKIVAENMKAAGSVRKRKEAEAIERRNLAYFIANMDDDTKARVARLFGVARLPEGFIKDHPDPMRAPPRPGPHVTPVGGLTDAEIDILRRGGFETESRSAVVMDGPPSAAPPRRDRWKPWLAASGSEQPGGWKPWGWIEV